MEYGILRTLVGADVADGDAGLVALILGQDGFYETIAVQVRFTASGVTCIDGRVPYRQSMCTGRTAVQGDRIDGVVDAFASHQQR